MRANSLIGKNAFFVGGSSGIGLAAARLAQEMGANVILGGNNARQLTEEAGILKCSGFAGMDVSDRRSVQSAVQDLPRIDHLIITAGRRITGRLVDSEPDQLLEAVRERVWGAVYVVHSLLGKLAPGASIILTSGVLSQRPSAPGNSVLAASVGAVEALVRGLAIELQPMRVNVKSPRKPEPVGSREFPQQESLHEEVQIQ